VEARSDDDLVANCFGSDLSEPRIGQRSVLGTDTSEGGEGDRVATGLGQEVATKAEAMGPAGTQGPGAAHQGAGMIGEFGSLDHSLHPDPSI
jgi:hypothetical protein